MSEQRNRNTPNGFNTSSYNTLGLLVYENPKKLQPQNESEVRAWLTSVGKSGIQEFEQSTISGTPIIRTEEVDGIGSIGVNYYLFGPKFIYAFGTDDFPEEAMEQYLSGFSILGRL
ncbi:MAG: hypothetical protein HY567_02995 [Candidatus Kerfeldbacteria bacterium]|nr:hypothetical protein [Candidatus Kerfeldbacteria bacterium]